MKSIVSLFSSHQEYIYWIIILIILTASYYVIFGYLNRVAKKSKNIIDDAVIQFFKLPVFLVLCSGLLMTFSDNILTEASEHIFHQINTIVLIALIAWLLMKVNKTGAYYLQKNLDLKSENNLNARRDLTKIQVFQKIINALIIIVGLSLCLLTFDKARTIGVSLLTSAGIVGVIVGLAAQKSIGMILAGIQIAITQPIRLEDVVVVEGEFGKIEEISLTYVVVKIWDNRRLIVPITYFMEKPFHNWTRSSTEIIGTVFLYLDYNAPIEKIRTFFLTQVKDHPDWDGAVANVEVTNSTESGMEIRMLMSSKDASDCWNLRTFIREKMIGYIQLEFPESLLHKRVVNREATPIKGSRVE